MSWIEAIPAVLYSLAILTLPGAGIAYLLRFRGISFFAVAIAASLALQAMASIILPYLGMTWGVIEVLAVAVIVTVLCLVIRFVPAINSAISSFGNWGGAYQYFGVLVATIIVGVSFVAISGSAGAISQTYDVVFHYNLTQYIVDTGNASPFSMDMIWQTSPAFYPSLWQAVAALTSPFVGAITANNLLVLLMMAVLWPLAATFMVQVILGDRRQYLLLTGVLAAAFPAFPLLFADWGALYPTLLSYSLIPIAFAAVVSLVGLAQSPMRTTTAWVVLLGSVFAMGVAQPSGIYALLVLALAPVVVFVIRALRQYSPRSLQGILILAAAILGIIAFVLLWRSGINSNHWDVRITPSQAAGDVLFNAVPGRLPGLTVSALAIIGAIIIWKQAKQRWILISYLLVATLYVFASSLPVESIRNLFAGIWYADNRRIMAILPVVVLLLAVLGASHLFSWVREKAFPNLSCNNYIALFLVVLVVVSQAVGMNHARYALWKEYEYNEASDLITPDEQAVFDFVADQVPEDAVIIGNPWTGTSMVYPITKHKVLFHHMTGQFDEGQRSLAQNLNSSGQEICATLADLEIEYALDFGGKLIFDDLTKADVPEQIAFFRGLNDLERSSLLTEVYSSGDAKLYQVTSCH